MLDLEPFFLRALLAGIGIALITGPLGCFIIWRRMAYFGDTMAHSSLLGVALAFLLEINITLGVFAIALLIALALVLLQRKQTLSTDALLGILSHSTLALGLVLIALMSWVRVDLISYLFGDILAVSALDLVFIYAGGAIVLSLLCFLWRPLLALTVNAELAEAEGMQPERTKILFMVLMAAVISIAMKIVGIILITSLLIIPAATVRRSSSSPEMMAALAACAGVLSVIAGLFGSLKLDTPSGPSIVVAALLLFLMVQVNTSIFSFFAKR